MRMNTKKASQILEREGAKVTKYDRHTFFVYWGFGSEVEEYDGAELVRAAREYTSDSKRNTTIKSSVKEFRHRKNRAATRRHIDIEDFDSFPANHLIKDDDVWNWD
jgi:arginine/lysine/ornithine decarboxylase